MRPEITIQDLHLLIIDDLNFRPQTIAEAEQLLSDEDLIQELRCQLEHAISANSSKRIDLVDCELMILKLFFPLLVLLHIVGKRILNDLDYSILKSIESANDMRLSLTGDELWTAFQQLRPDVTEGLVRQLAGVRLRSLLLPIIQRQDKEAFDELLKKEEIEEDIDQLGRNVEFVKRSFHVFEEKEVTTLLKV